MDFEEIIKKIFRPDVAKKLIDGISASPEEQKRLKLMFMFHLMI